jgi:predicted regulator of amino acid metabolism with ACT domain
MKFSELREANLSKAQIKKVHDKADDLPKNDFIKRYGKEGDSVRFATATKMVKKELGIEDYEEGFKSDAQRRAAFASGYKEKGKKKDEAIKGNDFVGVSTSAREYIQGKQAAKDGKKYDDNPYKSGNREMNIRRLNWSAGHNKAREEYEVEEGFKNDAQRQAAVASLYSKLGLKGASKRSREKDKGKKKEEVEITEAISDAQVAQIARMTDRNDHFGVRIEIARLMKDKQLMSFYDSLEKMHMTSQIQNAIGNDAVNLRGKLEKVLKVRMKQRFGDKDSKRIMDAL